MYAGGGLVSLGAATEVVIPVAINVAAGTSLLAGGLRVGIWIGSVFDALVTAGKAAGTRCNGVAGTLEVK